MSYSESIGKVGSFEYQGFKEFRNRFEAKSDHKFSPNRLNLFEASGTGFTRQFVQYGETSGFRDEDDVWILSPPQGEYKKVETASSISYTPAFTMKPSVAFKLNRSLQTGDKVTVGFGDADLNNDMANADGWILEFVPSLNDNEAYFSIYRNGNVVSNGGTKTVVSFENSITSWGRIAIEFSWYGVGNAKLEESYTQNGKFINKLVDKVSVDGSRSASSGSRRLQISVFNNNTDSLEVETGTVGLSEIGKERQQIQRNFIFQETVSLGSLAKNTWAPIRAFRTNKNNGGVEVFTDKIEPISYGGNNIKLLIQGIDKSNITFDGTDSWSSLPLIPSSSSYVETRSDVNQFVDDSKSLVSDTTTPGGYQLNFGQLVAQGAQNVALKGGSIQSDTRTRLNERDVALLLAFVSSQNTLSYQYKFTENW